MRDLLRHYPPGGHARWMAILMVTACGVTSCEQPLLPEPERLSPSEPSYSALDIMDTWIVVFHDEVNDPEALALDMVARSGGEILSVYRHALKGFFVRVPEAGARTFERNPNVAFVEANQLVRPNQVQSSAPWHLDRIDQRALPLDGEYHYLATGAASGVRIYVVDTGLADGHQEFGGRELPGWHVSHLSDTVDCNGHGTWVASVAAGSSVGVAKGAYVVPVRIVGCDASDLSTGFLINGLDWVAGNHVKPAVVNLSWSHNSTSSSLETAVKGVVSAGVPVAVAAGHSESSIFGDTPGHDACGFSPQRMPEAITVSATDGLDARGKWSLAGGIYFGANWGTCVDIWAPGVSIQLASISSSDSYVVRSGTSFAAPAVAGALALILDHEPNLTVQQVTGRLHSLATWTTITDGGPGSPNRLLYAPNLKVWLGGPDLINEADNYQWFANHYGHAPQSYLWEYRPVTSSSWQVVGTGQSYNRYVTLADWDFWLKVTASVEGVDAMDNMYVTVTPPPCDPGDPLCPQLIGAPEQ